MRPHARVAPPRAHEALCVVAARSRPTKPTKAAPARTNRQAKAVPTRPGPTIAIRSAMVCAVSQQHQATACTTNLTTSFGGGLVGARIQLPFAASLPPPLSLFLPSLEFFDILVVDHLIELVEVVERLRTVGFAGGLCPDGATQL